MTHSETSGQPDAAGPPGIEARRARFIEEAARHGLRYRCRDCAHVVPSTVTCSMLFPNQMLRDVVGPFQPDGSYAFCKYFELGAMEGAARQT